MKYIGFVLLVLIFIFLSSDAAIASPPAPTPVCQITGKIESVQFKDAYDEPCLKQPGGVCPSDSETQHPARYYLEVQIEKASYASSDISYTTCDKLFPSFTKQAVFINKDEVKPGDLFAVNDRIEGTVSGGNYLESYSLKIPSGSNAKKNIIYLVVAAVIIGLGIMVFNKRNQKA